MSSEFSVKKFKLYLTFLELRWEVSRVVLMIYMRVDDETSMDLKQWRYLEAGLDDVDGIDGDGGESAGGASGNERPIEGRLARDADAAAGAAGVRPADRLEVCEQRKVDHREADVAQDRRQAPAVQARQSCKHVQLTCPGPQTLGKLPLGG